MGERCVGGWGYRVGQDGLDGDKLNHTSGCKGQHTLADFSPMHGAYSPIWRAEATENPSLDDGPEIRAGMRNPKRKSPSSNHCGWNRVAVEKVDLFAGGKHRPYLLKKSRHRLANVARLLSDIINNH